jgi:serine/threonine-protein kinase HipA
MDISQINTCPAILAPSFNTYSPIGLKRVFEGRKVSHILDYDAPGKNEDESEIFLENRKRLSISGVQEKMSFILDGKTLRLTKPEERGSYILKPIPRDVRNVKEVPANEHLTMQIARQVYGIQTAENALVFFRTGEPAYITKRFDLRPNGLKWRKEDFASLAGRSKENAGPDFKYEGSYEEIAALIRKYVPAWRIEIEKFFAMVVFNFMFSNGDAHLKNFGLLETEQADFILSPAYDLMNTRMHVNDTDLALRNGLFADGSKSILWERTGMPVRSDFIKFGIDIGITQKRVEKLFKVFVVSQKQVAQLITNSYLIDPMKKAYLSYYNRKINHLSRF